jgi:hypothetical protein
LKEEALVGSVRRIHFGKFMNLFHAVNTGAVPGIKQSVRGVDHPPASSASVKESVELYLYSPMDLHVMP